MYLTLSRAGGVETVELSRRLADNVLDGFGCLLDGLLSVVNWSKVYLLKGGFRFKLRDGSGEGLLNRVGCHVVAGVWVLAAVRRVDMV